MDEGSTPGRKLCPQLARDHGLDRPGIMDLLARYGDNLQLNHI